MSWSAEQDATLTRLYCREGRDAAEIACALMRTFQSVDGRIAALGLVAPGAQQQAKTRPNAQPNPNSRPGRSPKGGTARRPERARAPEPPVEPVPTSIAAVPVACRSCAPNCVPATVGAFPVETIAAGVRISSPADELAAFVRSLSPAAAPKPDPIAPLIFLTACESLARDLWAGVDRLERGVHALRRARRKLDDAVEVKPLSDFETTVLKMLDRTAPIALEALAEACDRAPDAVGRAVRRFEQLGFVAYLPAERVGQMPLIQLKRLPAGWTSTIRRAKAPARKGAA